MRTRREHLAFCKKRALEYCDRGELGEAFTSMGSDLDHHPETKNHIGVTLGLQLMMIGGLSTKNEMRKFIEGFN